MDTKFEEEINNCVSYNEIVNRYIENALRIDLEKKDIANFLKDIKTAYNYLCQTLNFLRKYGDFFNSIDQKFGTGFYEMCNSAKKTANDIVNDCKNVNINASQERFDVAQAILNETLKKVLEFKNVFAKITTLPHIVDFSKLSHDDWRKIGIAGVHYRSRIFLSYHFRDKDPKKDDNQKFIDYSIIPLLNLLNIEPITARTHLKSQGLIEEDTISLIKDCDGIIGFYTANDPIENVEHELSNSQNVIAICKEEGASSPSMRRSRLQFDFKRNEPSSFLIELIRALKDKEMFRLVV